MRTENFYKNLDKLTFTDTEIAYIASDHLYVRADFHDTLGARIYPWPADLIQLNLMDTEADCQIVNNSITEPAHKVIALCKSSELMKTLREVVIDNDWDWKFRGDSDYLIAQARRKYNKENN